MVVPRATHPTPQAETVRFLRNKVRSLSSHVTCCFLTFCLQTLLSSPITSSGLFSCHGKHVLWTKSHAMSNTLDQRSMKRIHCLHWEQIALILSYSLKKILGLIQTICTATEMLLVLLCVLYY